MSRTKRARKSATPTPRQVRLRDNRVREIERQFRELRREHDEVLRELADTRAFTREIDYNLCERILELRDRSTVIEARLVALERWSINAEHLAPIEERIARLESR